MSKCCVICYRVVPQRNLTDYYADGNNNGLLVLKRFFKLFARYVDEGNGTETGERKFPLEKVIEFGMTSCEDCLHVMEAFCELYHERERIELLLKWKVWTVKNLMECAQKVPSRIRDFRERVQKLEKDDERSFAGGSLDRIVNLVAKSKKSLIKKCHKKVLKGFPKLSIPKWQGPDLLGSHLQKNTLEEICLTDHQSVSIELGSMLCNGDEMTMKTQLPTSPNIGISKHNQEVLEGDSSAGFTEDPTSNEVSLSNIPKNTTEDIGGAAEGDANQLQGTLTLLSMNAIGNETIKNGQEYTAESECVQQLTTLENILRTAGEGNLVTTEIVPIQNTVNEVVNYRFLVKREHYVNSAVDSPSTRDHDHDRNDIEVAKDGNLNDDDDRKPTSSASTQIPAPLTETQLHTAAIPSSEFVEVAATAAKPSAIPLKRSLCADNNIDYEASGLVKTEIISVEAAVENDEQELVETPHGTDIENYAIEPTGDDGSQSPPSDFVEVTAAPATPAKDQPATLKINDESTPSQRFLRTVHRCNSCKRTFSSKERLTNHEVDCCVNDEDDTDIDVDSDKSTNNDDATSTVENKNNIEDDYDDTTTDTSDGIDDDIPDAFSCQEEADDINMSGDELIQSDQKQSISKLRTGKAHCIEGGVTPWQCSICKLPYRGHQTLVKHLLLKHPAKWKEIKKLGPRHSIQAYLGYSNSKPSPYAEKPKVAYRFRCHNCTLMFTDMHSLLLHRQQRHPPLHTPNKEVDRKLRTTTVKIMCFSSVPLLRHFRRSKDAELFATLQVPDNGIFSCPKKKCRLPFYSKDDLQGHRKLHGKFKCQFCETVKNYAPNLVEHELTHVKTIKNEGDSAAGGNPPVSFWKCSRCSEKFQYKNFYMAHYLSAHLSLAFIGNRCVICSSYKPRGNSLLRHLSHYKMQHDIGACAPDTVKRCKAGNCSSYFTSVKALLNHHKLRHATNDKEQLKDIKRKEREKESLQCKDCDHLFTSKHSLRAHRLNHHVNVDSQLHCKVDICKFACETEEDLENHVYYRHSVRNMEFIECPKCSKQCNGVSSLKAHMRCHKNLKGTDTKMNLQRRRKKAPKKENRFKCSDCSHLFLRLPELLQHWNKSHSHSQSGSEEANKITVEILSFSKATVPISLDKAKDFKIFAKIQVPNKIFECLVTTCQKLFLSAEDLHIHSKLHGEFKCDFCDVVKDYAPDLSEHEVNHSVEEKGGTTTTASSWKCSRCPLEFSSKEKYLDHHGTSHLSVVALLEEVQCGICGMKGAGFSKKSKLIRHYKRVHDILSISNSRPVKTCLINSCGAYFLTQKQLSMHLNRSHSNCGKEVDQTALKEMRQRFKCRDCDKKYMSIFRLRCHRRSVHPTEVNLIHRCAGPGCKFACETAEELTNHGRFCKRSENANLTKECPKCKKLINGKGHFERHLKAHERKEQIEAGVNPTPFVCEICGKGFKRKCGLKQHSVIIHASPESWDFTCGVCAKKCTTRQKLDEHKRTHTKEKPFVCEICGVKYAHRHNLRIHVNNKHGAEVQDKLRKFDKTNLTSKKGVKRKRKGNSKVSENETSSDSD